MSLVEMKAAAHQVGAADPDVDNVSDALPTEALPLAAPHSL